ncbi:MAG: hypothetical protein P8182_17125 [Deltaproteobacteria bacterium]
MDSDRNITTRFIFDLEQDDGEISFHKADAGNGKEIALMMRPAAARDNPVRIVGSGTPRQPD